MRTPGQGVRRMNIASVYSTMVFRLCGNYDVSHIQSIAMNIYMHLYIEWYLLRCVNVVRI